MMNETIEQLGGRRIFAMAFDAKRSTCSDTQLQLRIAAALVKGIKDKPTHVRITLDASDTYTVELLRVNRRTWDVAMLRTVSGVYADSLRSLVESMTGLRLTLGAAPAARPARAARFIQTVDGMTLAHEFGPEVDLVAAMAVRGHELIGHYHNERTRAELQGAPMFAGINGPMWDGDRLRYEDVATTKLVTS